MASARSPARCRSGTRPAARRRPFRELRVGHHCRVEDALGDEPQLRLRRRDVPRSALVSRRSPRGAHRAPPAPAWRQARGEPPGCRTMISLPPRGPGVEHRRGTRVVLPAPGALEHEGVAGPRWRRARAAARRWAAGSRGVPRLTLRLPPGASDRDRRRDGGGGFGRRSAGSAEGLALFGRRRTELSVTTARAVPAWPLPSPTFEAVLHPDECGLGEEPRLAQGQLEPGRGPRARRAAPGLVVGHGAGAKAARQWRRPPARVDAVPTGARTCSRTCACVAGAEALSESRQSSRVVALGAGQGPETQLRREGLHRAPRLPDGR